MQHIYQNEFGTLYHDRISVIVANQKKIISKKDIIKIRLIKKKTNSLLYAILLVCAVSFSIFYPSEHAILAIMITAMLLLLSIKLKLNQYKIIIIKKNEFIKIELEKKLSTDAGLFIQRFNELHQL